MMKAALGAVMMLGLIFGTAPVFSNTINPNPNAGGNCEFDQPRNSGCHCLSVENVQNPSLSPDPLGNPFLPPEGTIQIQIVSRNACFENMENEQMTPACETDSQCGGDVEFGDVCYLYLVRWGGWFFPFGPVIENPRGG